jgi:RimJ/RimL family protein N-acetyltransferase
MNKIKIIPIGKINNDTREIAIKLDETYITALKGLEDYSHIQIIWWMDGCDNKTDRAILMQKKPYRNGPNELGVFALRSPERPNPIGVSNAQIENNRMAKVALRIAPAYQNQAIATEAMKAIIDFCFTHTELQRIWTDVDIRNIGSWKVLEKCGFTREGMIRQGKMVNTWCDYYIYGLLKNS